MELTRERLRFLTIRVACAYHSKYRDRVNELFVLSQLEHVDGIVFITLSKQYTRSSEEEILALGSKADSIADGISVFNAS